MDPHAYHPLHKCRALMCRVLDSLISDRRQRTTSSPLQQTQRWPRSIFRVLLSGVLRRQTRTDQQCVTGGIGERHAARFLRRLGYRIVKRNYRCAVGEIDLVALDGSTIVFVEVKARASREHADPQDAVNPGKQRRLTRAAKTFLAQTQSLDRVCRFDVVAIILDGKKAMEIEHIQDAFEPRF